MEFTPAIIQDFELYLTTVALCAYNTAVKKMKTLKTVTIIQCPNSCAIGICHD